MVTAIQLYVSCDIPDDDLADMVVMLREELLCLDVEEVRPLTAGPPPTGARAGWADLPGLAVIAETSAAVLGPLVATVHAWRGRAVPRPTIRLEIDGDVLEITGATAGQADRAFDHFLQRHGLPKVER